MVDQQLPHASPGRARSHRSRGSRTTSNAGSTSSSPRVSSSTTFQSGKNENAIPTNVITYKGRRIPARIDPDASILRVVEIMAKSFNAPEHHITLALRDESDNLVTQANIASKVASRETLKLVPAPNTEAVTVVMSLIDARGIKRGCCGALPRSENSQVPEDAGSLPAKLALFNLQKYIKEDDFAVEFMLKGGVKFLVDLITDEGPRILTGNSLAYALQGIRGVMDYDNGWGNFSDAFIDRVIRILASSSVTNVVRPATVIIRKLVNASPKTHGTKGKSKARDDDAVNNYGFERIFGRISEAGMQIDDGQVGPGAERVFRPIVKRLEVQRDLELVSQSLALINACLRSAQQEGSKRYSELINVIETLGTRRHVARLIPVSSNNMVEGRILDFQNRYANVLRYHSLRPVRPATNTTHERYLSDIWNAGRLDAEEATASSINISSPRVSSSDYHVSGGPRTWEGWRRMGLSLEFADDSEELNEAELFRSVGELGLECLHYYAMHEENFHSVVLEQQARPEDRRCPIGRASAECVKVLYDHYKISQSAQRGSVHFQPFMLNFPRLHSLVLKFFLRMWQDSESRLDDFERLSYLVTSQVRLTLTNEHTKTWLNLENDFLGTDYRNIRDGQMEMIDKEDGLLERPAVNDLRDKVRREAYEVVSDQRLLCMMQGSWFNAAHVLVPGIEQAGRPSPSKPLRFVRLSHDQQTLYWGEFVQRTAVPPSYDQLKYKISLDDVTEVHVQTGCAIGSRSPDLVSKLSISLMSGPNLSLLDIDAIHAQQFAEWTDGLLVLKGQSEMGTQESNNYVHILTELALKIRLLDITGDGIEIPQKVNFGNAPKSTDFWFAG